MSEEVRGRETRPQAAIEQTTVTEYVRLGDLALGAANRLLMINDSFGIPSLTHKDVSGPVLAFIAEIYGPEKAACTSAALLRIAATNLGSDPSHTEHINALGTEVRTRFPDPEIDLERQKQLRNWARDPSFMARLKGAPAAILARAEEPGLKPVDRLTRASVAVSVQLKQDHQALSSAEVTCLDLASLTGPDGDTPTLWVADPMALGRLRPEPLTDITIAVITAREKIRLQAGITSTLLHPARHRRALYRDSPPATHSSEEVVVTCIADELEMVMGLRMTFRDLKDLAAYRTLSVHPDKVNAIAEALGIVHPTNLAARMKPVIRKRRK